MADRNVAIVKQPIWMKLAEEAKVKEETEKAAAAKAAFDATFKAVDASQPPQPAEDSDSDVDEDLSAKPLGPVDPSKCSAAGVGIAGGSAGSASTFVVVTKDPDGRKTPAGGAQLKVKVSPAVGVGGPDQEGVVKDQGDGTYSVTYIVPKRGNYNVFVECNGKSIMGSPFPVFFSQGQVAAATNIGGSMSLTPVISSAQFPNRVNQTMPNMPNYAGSVSGAFPGLLGMMPGALPSASGGVVLQGIGASLGEICGEYLKGRCLKTDCKLNHPPHNLLMSYLAAATTTMTMGTMNHVPMAPSAAAMAAAQAIVAAQTLQAHAAQMQTAGDSSGSPDKADVLKRTVQVSNLNPLLTSDQLKQLFAFCGTVADCTITDSKHFAFVEYSKAEEATAALAMNNMDVGGRPLNVEMAKTLPPKSAYASSSLPSMIQQAVAMQQMQFQQSLIMQQTIANQQAATRAATMKSATEMASARAAEISKKLKQDGLGNDDEEAKRRSRSPLASQRRSKSRSGSPIRYRRSRRSRSLSPPRRYSRSRRWSRSPPRSHYSNHGSERRSYRDVQDRSSQGGRREREKSRERYSSASRRNRRSLSPRVKDSSRAGSVSPKRHREISSPRTKRSTRAGSRSPRHHRGTRSSPARNHGTTSHHNRRSKTISPDGRRRSDDKEDAKKSEKPKYRRSISRSADGRHHSNNSEDAKMLEKPKTKRSRSRSADVRRHSDHKDVKRSDRPRRRHSRSRSAERGRLSDHKDAKESEKLIQEEQHKQDDKKSDRNDLKDSRGPRESKTVDPPAVGHKRSTLLPEDEELGSETCTNNHKKSDRSIEKDSREPREYKTVDSSAEAGFPQRGNLSDDKDAKESEKLMQEEHQKQYNKISDRSEIKDSSDPSESMTVDSSAVSLKRNSFLTEDEAERSQECMNHHKKHKVDKQNFVRIASVIENQNLGNKFLEVTEDRTYERSPVPKPVKKSLTYRDDYCRTESRELRRHENFRPDKEHNRSDYADREKEHVTKSGHSKDVRRASHHSSSRPHRSSRHLEDISHRDTRNHRKLDKSKEESVVFEDIDETANTKSIEEEVMEKAITTQEINPMAYEHANFKYASELISHIPIIDVGGSCMEGENRLDVYKAEVNLEDASFDSRVYPDNNATCLREDGITEATGVPMSPCDPNNLISTDADLNFD